jgi:hypothetical protein
MTSILRVLVSAVLVLTFADVRAASEQVATGADLQSLIKAFVGTWTLSVKFEPSPGAPKGVEGHGEETWRAAAGDLTLADEESFAAGSMKMNILGLFWTDRKTHELHALDCNNQNPHTCGLQDAIDGVAVHWSGKELTVDEKESGPDGKPMISRIVWSNITPASFVETGYFGPPGGPFKKGMTITATRK